VMSAMSLARLTRALVLALPGLALVLTGCESDTYPASLQYTPRTDLIVEKPPTDEPFYAIAPGQFEANIARFKGMQGATVYDPKDLPAGDRAEIEKALVKAFGKPAAPEVAVADDEAKEQIKELKLDKETLTAGSVLYRHHCLYCHGLDGDGRGPTGPWVSPHPRDYRPGLFKFISTDIALTSEGIQRKPRRADLHRTLVRGVEGTSMPAFSVLDDKSLDQIISYVIHLSLRGQVELDTMRNILQNKGHGGLENSSIPDHVQARAAEFVGYWYKSNDKSTAAPDYPKKYEDPKSEEFAASVRRGYRLFLDTSSEAGCISCHLDYGRQVKFRYDEWGTLVRAANLTAGVYRGGRRPIDLYWRIKNGILGAQMPKVDFPNPEQYWDLVNFVQALPYPQMLPEKDEKGHALREAIYPTTQAKEPAQHASR
jgi:mono/diheme cytochrome c family protein